MGAAVAVFVIVTGTTIGVFWAFVLRPEMRDQQELKRRLEAVRGIPEAPASVIRQRRRLSALEGLDRMLLRSGALAARLQGQLDQAGLPYVVGVLLLAMGCSAMLAFVLVEWTTDWMLPASVAAAFAATVPMAYVRWKRATRLRKIEALFPDTVDLIARGLRAGHGFVASLGMVADEMPPPIAEEFRILFDGQTYGLPLDRGFDELIDRVPLLDMRLFATAVLMQRDAGGNLAEVLENLGAVVRERLRIKRQIRVISAQGRWTGWLLVGMPPAGALLMWWINAQQLAGFVADPLGRRMVTVALVLQIAGVLVVRRVVNVEY